ncbi:MAG: DNA polymerase III subunit delta [Candidatus Omnitrophica bacterium]|nr:DNA polymerase III subunit delta [Candidatus Omnitrophota bacterium]
MPDIKTALVYLLIGDPFLCEEKHKILLDKIRKDIDGEVLSTKFRISETTLDEILLQSRSLPFLTSHQVFLVREAEDIKEKHLEPLRSYLKNPYIKTTLVFEAESVEKDHPLKKIIVDAGEVVLFEGSQKKRSGELFIKNKLLQYGKTILPQAVNRLMEKMGDHPILLHSILEQLALYATDQPVIDEAMVETFEESFEELDSFQLGDAIGNLRVDKAILILRKLLEHADSDVSALIGMLHWQFKRFWKVAVLLDSGLSQESALRECRIFPKQAHFFMKQFRLFSREKLEQVLEDLFQLDWKMKTGQVEGSSALETWLITTTQTTLLPASRQTGTFTAPALR